VERRNATNKISPSKVCCNAGTQDPLGQWVQVRWSLGWNEWVTVRIFSSFWPKCSSVYHQKKNQKKEIPAPESWAAKNSTLWMRMVQSPYTIGGHNIVMGGHCYQNLDRHILRETFWMLVYRWYHYLTSVASVGGGSLTQERKKGLYEEVGVRDIQIQPRHPLVEIQI